MNEKQEREAFEKWADKTFGPAPRTDIPQHERYASLFEVWKARAALPSASVGEPVAKVVREGDRKCIKFVGLNGLAVDVGTFLYTSTQPAATSDDAQDAARYRWLRENGEPDEGMAYRSDWRPSMYDQAIDAAMKEAQK